ncbi:uncharacterized protein LOC142230776 [Haematobia irritans]|uniref:uncharacterized protein LOC142230776 n=1 Tax=Haematobia irritans TaxID=7368 RepID=UPI003F503281
MAGKKRRSLIINKIFCGQCKMEVMESDSSIQCDSCERTYHAQCTQKDKREFEELIKDNSIDYVCHMCNKTKYENDLSEIKRKVNQLDDIMVSLKHMSSQYDEILKGIKTNTKKIEKLEKENKLLKEELAETKSSVKYLNDVRVQNNCIIRGIMSKETAVNTVLNIAEKIGSSTTEKEIEDAYFIGKGNEVQQRKTIVVKFSNQKNKKHFMEKKNKLKDCEELKNVYINDYLSKETQELFNYARSTKSVGYQFVYYKGSNVFVKKHDKSNQILIKTKEDVDKLLKKSTVEGMRRSRVIVPADDSSSEDDDNADEGVM